MLVLIFVALAAVLTVSLCAFLEHRYSTWKRKGVPGPRASVFNLSVPKVLVGKESVGDLAERIYTEYRESPVAGTYILTNPILHLNDPEVIKHVLIRDFQDFNGRGTMDPPDYDPLAKNLFLLSGHRWRNLRVKLTPTFTSGKIKYMFESIKKSSEQLSAYIEENVAAGGGKHCEDARGLVLRLFVDTVASVAFGIDSNVVKHADSAFHRAALDATQPSLSNVLRFLLALFAPKLMMALRVTTASSATQRFFTSVVRETVQYREDNNVQRADMLNLLIQLKNTGFVAPDKEDDSKSVTATATSEESSIQKLTMDDVASNVFIFFVAGFESSASTTSLTLYHLARDPDILDKALREVDQVLADFDGQITYDSVMAMPYLGKCVSETLRMYPPLAYISREAMRTRKVPLTDVVVDKGTHIVIPVRALHYDPAYWPDPDRYDPERFSEEQKSQRPSQVYMPFGDGPRLCIAYRLGLVQIKTALVTLLSKYTLSLAPGEPGKVPMNPKSFATTPIIPLNVTYHRRKPITDITKSVAG